MSSAYDPGTETSTGLIRRRALEEVKARLCAIADSLSDLRIDAQQLHKDAEEPVQS